eukprot:5937484-Amphidinium_carterae.1
MSVPFRQYFTCATKIRHLSSRRSALHMQHVLAHEHNRSTNIPRNAALWKGQHVHIPKKVTWTNLQASSVVYTSEGGHVCAVSQGWKDFQSRLHIPRKTGTTRCAHGRFCLLQDWLLDEHLA